MEKNKLRHIILKSQTFKRAADKLDAWENVDALKFKLDESPDYGDVIPGGSGLRKVRMRLPGRGTRGSAGVIYYQVVDECLLLVDKNAKNDKSDLSAQELTIDLRIRDEMLKKYEELKRGKKSP